MRRRTNTIKASMLTLAIVLAGTITASAQQEPSAACEDAVTQADLNSCTYLEFEAADKELNTVYKQAMKSQEEVDKQAAEMGEGYVGAVKALRKAQRAWIDYRDGHCDGVGYEAVGGSMQPMLINGCLATMTKTRTKELRELMEGLGN